MTNNSIKYEPILQVPFVRNVLRPFPLFLYTPLRLQGKNTVLSPFFLCRILSLVNTDTVVISSCSFHCKNSRQIYAMENVEYWITKKKKEKERNLPVSERKLRWVTFNLILCRSCKCRSKNRNVTQTLWQRGQIIRLFTVFSMFNIFSVWCNRVIWRAKLYLRGNSAPQSWHKNLQREFILINAPDFFRIGEQVQTLSDYLKNTHFPKFRCFTLKFHFQSSYWKGYEKRWKLF